MDEPEKSRSRLRATLDFLLPIVLLPIMIVLGLLLFLTISAKDWRERKAEQAQARRRS